MSPVSAAAMQAMYEQNTGEVPIEIVTVDNPDAPGVAPFPLRVANHPADVVSNGNTFTAGSFEVIPPDQEAGLTEVAMKVGLNAPPHEFIAALRPLTCVPTFLVQVVLVSDPDVILREWADLKLRNVDADNVSIVFELRYEQLSEVPFPGHRYSVPLFPGLY